MKKSWIAVLLIAGLCAPVVCPQHSETITARRRKGSSYVAPTFNGYGYSPAPVTGVTTNNTFNGTGAGGYISVTSGDLVIATGQAAQSVNTSITTTVSPSATLTGIPPASGFTGYFTELNYGLAASTSSSFYATATVANSQGNLGVLVLDFTCGTCAFVTSYSVTQSTASSITITGISATAGAHGLLAVMCSSDGGQSRVWTVGSINGVTATAAGSSSVTNIDGAIFCQYVFSSSSFSSASASVSANVAQITNAQIAIWSY